MHQLTGRIQHYAWGSPTAIPEILGMEPTSEPHAEYWLGAHPSAPSGIADTTLDAFLANHRECLGAGCESFGGLPYLMKILAADKPLSIQAHPTREQAEAGFAREEAAGVSLSSLQRTYKDTWPKPELIVSLTGMDVLFGFRPALETHQLFEELGVGEELHPVIGPLADRGGSAALAEVFLDVLSLDDERRELVNFVVARAMDHTGDDGPVGEFARTAVDLDAHFPGDRGILGALLLNRFHLEPGEGLFVPAGVLHAYLGGVGVETMANSDNVVRGGLTSKHIDVDELVNIVDFSPLEVQPQDRVEEAPGVTRYATPAPEFQTWRISSGSAAIPGRGARIVLLTDGTAALTCGTDTLSLRQGEAALVCDQEVVALDGACTAFVCGVGQ